MGHHLPIIEDLLEDSVNHAKECFVIAQLGARYGTYIVLSSFLLKKKKPSLNSISIGVEASSFGYSNLLVCMEKCELNSSPNVFRQVAISDSISSVAFLEAGEDGVGSHMLNRIAEEVDESVEVVNTTTIEELIKDVSHVDFLEMDIQGAEYKAIPCSISSISEKVKMICIRTHWPPADEKELEAIFTKHGWQKVLVYYNKTQMVIAGKEQPLNDGVQCWVNTNLREPCNVTCGN